MSSPDYTNQRVGMDFQNNNSNLMDSSQDFDGSAYRPFATTAVIPEIMECSLQHVSKSDTESEELESQSADNWESLVSEDHDDVMFSSESVLEGSPNAFSPSTWSIASQDRASIQDGMNKMVYGTQPESWQPTVQSLPIIVKPEAPDFFSCPSDMESSGSRDIPGYSMKRVEMNRRGFSENEISDDGPAQMSRRIIVPARRNMKKPIDFWKPDVVASEIGPGFSCKFCSCAFKNLRILDNHCASDHLKDLCTVTATWSLQYQGVICVRCTQKYAVCIYCGEEFYGKRSMKKHILNHELDKTYQCTICRETLVRKMSKFHLLAHKDLRARCRPCARIGKNLLSRSSLLSEGLKIQNPRLSTNISRKKLRSAKQTKKLGDKKLKVLLKRINLHDVLKNGKYSINLLSLRGTGMLEAEQKSSPVLNDLQDEELTQSGTNGAAHKSLDEPPSKKVKINGLLSNAQQESGQESIPSVDSGNNSSTEQAFHSQQEEPLISGRFENADSKSPNEKRRADIHTPHDGCEGVIPVNLNGVSYESGNRQDPVVTHTEQGEHQLALVIDSGDTDNAVPNDSLSKDVIGTQLEVPEGLREELHATGPDCQNNLHSQCVSNNEQEADLEMTAQDENDSISTSPEGALSSGFISNTSAREKTCEETIVAEDVIETCPRSLVESTPEKVLSNRQQYSQNLNELSRNLTKATSPEGALSSAFISNTSAREKTCEEPIVAEDVIETCPRSLVESTPEKVLSSRQQYSQNLNDLSRNLTKADFLLINNLISVKLSFETQQEPSEQNISGVFANAEIGPTKLSSRLITEDESGISVTSEKHDGELTVDASPVTELMKELPDKQNNSQKDSTACELDSISVECRNNPSSLREKASGSAHGGDQKLIQKLGSVGSNSEMQDGGILGTGQFITVQRELDQEFSSFIKLKDLSDCYLIIQSMLDKICRDQVMEKDVPEKQQEFLSAEIEDFIPFNGSNLVSNSLEVNDASDSQNAHEVMDSLPNQSSLVTDLQMLDEEFVKCGTLNLVAFDKVLLDAPHQDNEVGSASATVGVCEVCHSKIIKTSRDNIANCRCLEENGKLGQVPGSDLIDDLLDIVQSHMPEDNPIAERSRVPLADYSLLNCMKLGSEDEKRSTADGTGMESFDVGSNDYEKNATPSPVSSPNLSNESSDVANAPQNDAISLDAVSPKKKSRTFLCKKCDKFFKSKVCFHSHITKMHKVPTRQRLTTLRDGKKLQDRQRPIKNRVYKVYKAVAR